MYFTETMFNPEYINPPYFKQQQTQMKNPATRGILHAPTRPTTPACGTER